MSASIGRQLAHRAFLNRYYGAARHVYDATRRYYLVGRDRALAGLLGEEWDSLVEIGVGTGRNLRVLHGTRPSATYGGVEACDAMLDYARPRCPWASLVHGFAENVDLASVLGRAPERILFSYALSMMVEPEAALERAVASLEPGGAVYVVDFADLAGLPRPLRAGLRHWLSAFHVAAPAIAVSGDGATVTYGPMRYYFLARIPAAASALE